ncbi:MAG: biopolymer transporter ExbD [Bacteroidales bacterium]|nr:biopolymer transporter ExbD [Bacteroidales bacterium]MDD3907131.1 biopolymer transporter ExbD [Bacteroidales bacterium]MEA4839850.1 biopolymer transporter ExbD [Bacteroidales bacterium]
MAEVNTGGGDKPKKGKPHKKETRVDFTPMVDMNMLLITFFMLCTSMSKPQTMEIVMPTKDKNLTEQEKNKVKDTNAITLILGADDKVYYYLGKPNYKDYSSTKVANYGGAEDKNSLRSLLLERNKVGVAQVQKLKQLKYKKQISDADFTKQVAEIKDSKDGQVVIIKPTDESTYMNLIDALDEMQICSIGKYAIVDVEAGDKYLVENLQKQGALTKASDIK